MSDLTRPFGFEEALRPPVDLRRARLTPGLLKRLRSVQGGARDKLARVARRALEVMVKITGKTRSASHLLSHLQYISRNGALRLEGPDGEHLRGPEALRTLAEDWAAEAALEPRGRRGRPLSLSVVLSMPAGTDPRAVEAAGRAFAREVFADQFPYVFALHDEGRHPHVHLTVRTLGENGERLNPRKADLQLWREAFAGALRDRGIEAEATPRRARGVRRKPERTAVRKLRDRYEAGDGRLPEVMRQAIAAVLRGEPAHVAEQRSAARAEATRRAYAAEAIALERSGLGRGQQERAQGQGYDPVSPRRRMTQREEIRARAGARSSPDRAR